MNLRRMGRGGCDWRGTHRGSTVFMFEFDFFNWVLNLQVVIFLFLKLYICIRYSLLYL